MSTQGFGSLWRGILHPGLAYCAVTGRWGESRPEVPMSGLAAGPARQGTRCDGDPAVIEREIAIEIVRQGIPIRGAEVKFLRKSLGLSMERFGRLLGLSPPAILKWERKPHERLHPTNEVAVRALMAERLNITLEGKFTVLKGKSANPGRLTLRVA